MKRRRRKKSDREGAGSKSAGDYPGRCWISRQLRPGGADWRAKWFKSATWKKSSTPCSSWLYNEFKSVMAQRVLVDFAFEPTRLKWASTISSRPNR